MLACGFFVCGFHIGFITTHLPPYLTDLGFSGSLAAWSLALIGLFNVIGAYTAGVLGGIHSKRLLLSGIYAGRAVLFALFLIVPTTPAVVLAVRRRHGPAVAVDRAAHLGARGRHVRHPPRRDAVRLRLPLAPDRRVPRRLARRRGLRGHGRVRSDVVALDRTRPGRGDGPSPDPRSGGRRSGRRARHEAPHPPPDRARARACSRSAAPPAGRGRRARRQPPAARFRLVCPLH